MTSILATLGAYIVGPMLLFAGLGHARRPAQLAEALRQHGIWPAWAPGALAVAVRSAELTLGSIALVPLLYPGARALLVLRTTLLGCTGLFGAYAAYSWFLLRRNPDAPCGCAGAPTHQPVSAVVVIRAAALSGAAGFALAYTQRIIWPAAGVHWLILLLMAIALGVTLWSLPAALGDPLRSPRPGAENSRMPLGAL